MSDPVCPKCGGPMWDNRATKTSPTQADYKCKAGKWDAAKKQTIGCDGVIWPPKEANASTDVALTVTLENYEPALVDYATKLKALLPNGAKLSTTEALAGAQYAKTTGLDPFRGEFFIVPGIGVVPGYKGVYARQGQQGREPDYRYRPLTEAERDWHDIQPGDKAVICYATEPAEAVQARQEGREPRVWEGFGVVREADQWKSYEWVTGTDNKRYKKSLPRDKWVEREDPPKNRSWGWKAQNSAMKDCANHMGIPVQMDADDILAQAEAAGIKIEIPAGAQLTSDQAEAAVADELATVARNAVPATLEEVQARFTENLVNMRAPAGFAGFGDEPLGSVDGEFTAAAEFTAIPNATTERTADAIINELRAAAVTEDGTAPPAATEADLVKVRAHIGRLVGRDPDRSKAHHLLQAIYRKKSTNDLTREEAATLWEWIDARKTKTDEGDVWIPRTQAIADWKAILIVYPYPEVGQIPTA
jgi:hypothetical protein